MTSKARGSSGTSGTSASGDDPRSDLAARLDALCEQARASGSLAELAAPLARWARAAAGAERAPAGEPAELPGRFGMVGDSPAMRAVFERIERVAPSDLAVLVRGETGTGKELVARALHDESPRRGKPFVVENCAAVPANLLESELFGHKRGSFTDAVADRVGHFQAADGGTIFLDEIGEMPVELQAKLLRVLDQQEVRPVGANEPLQVDVRIVAATNRDLAAMVQERRFREDLFYRLNTVEVLLPPLRERDGDIALLVRYLLARAAGEGGRTLEVDDAALEALTAFDWPGNVRQLMNEIQRALALGAGDTLTLSDLSPEVRDAAAGADRAP